MDNPVALATLITAVAAAVVSLIAALASAYTAVTSSRTHTLVNGQSRQIQDLVEARGYAQGVSDSKPSSDVTGV
jgi:hypothetical protein